MLWMCTGRPSCTRTRRRVCQNVRHTRKRTGNGKGDFSFTLSVCRRMCGQNGRVGYRRRGAGRMMCVRTLWKPIGQLSKISSRPGNCGKIRKEVRTLAITFLRGGERWGKGRERAHCAHRMGLYAGRAPRCRHPPLSVAIECNRGPSASPGTHCIRALSRSACAPRGEKARERENKRDKRQNGGVVGGGDGMRMI
jgi:hypothetical protein